MRDDDYSDDGGGYGGDEEIVKCAACNRSTQQPDIQVGEREGTGRTDLGYIARGTVILQLLYCCCYCDGDDEAAYL